MRDFLGGLVLATLIGSLVLLFIFAIASLPEEECKAYTKTECWVPTDGGYLPSDCYQCVSY